MNSLIAIVIVIVLAGIGVVGDYFIKIAGNGSKYISYPPFFIGMIIYALTAIGWFFVMKHIKLGVLGVFYSLTTVILLVVLGTFVFRERLNVYDTVGIVLGIVSICMLARFR